MTQDPSDSGKPARPQDAKAQREAKLAQALRDNLKRRKAQARARNHDTSPDAPSAPSNKESS